MQPVQQQFVLVPGRGLGEAMLSSWMLAMVLIMRLLGTSSLSSAAALLDVSDLTAASPALAASVGLVRPTRASMSSFEALFSFSQQRPNKLLAADAELVSPCIPASWQAQWGTWLTCAPSWNQLLWVGMLVFLGVGGGSVSMH